MGQDRPAARVAEMYFDKGQFEEAKAVAVQLMRYSHDHRVRARMAKLIADYNLALMVYEQPPQARLELDHKNLPTPPNTLTVRIAKD